MVPRGGADGGRDGHGLEPGHGFFNLATVKSGDEGPVVVDGPFSEAKEVVGGFTVVEVPDLDAALAMARTWPPLKFPGVSVEVRPVVDHDGDM